MGAGSWVEAPFYCDYGAQIHLGARVFVNMGCVFLDAAPIVLQDEVQLGPGVQLLTSDHPRDAAQRAAGLESARPITIGARAWLGGGTVVLPGVEIGHDTIIGAGSVVTRSVAPGVTAAGNPCRVMSEGRKTPVSEQETGRERGRVRIENVNHPGSTSDADAGMYRAMRDAILEVLPTEVPGMTPTQMLEAVVPRLPGDLFPGGAKAGWWSKAVQLDLEAKGTISRDSTKPLRLHRNPS